MSELTFHQQAVLWGQAYEVLVKRGSIAYLIEQGLLDADRPSLEQWRKHKLLKVSTELTNALDIIDEQQRAVVKAAVRHLALTAFGTGYTAMRAYLISVREHLRTTYRSFNADSLRLRTLWCPLSLPGASTDIDEAHAASRQALYEEFGLHGIVDPAWSSKGQPANADFMMWLSYAEKQDFLLVQEYSFDMPREIGDFREQGPHLEELMRHRRIVDSRSVFARVAAEVDGESFELSDDIKTFLTALTSENKPFHKLCQASSYAEITVRLLQTRGLLSVPCNARALAITPNGLESLGATFAPSGDKDPRIGLMTQMGAAYRGAQKVADGDERALEQQIEAAFKAVQNRLPPELKNGMSLLSGMPKPGEDYTFEFEESTTDFANPAQEFPLSEALEMVGTTQALEDYFGGPPKERIGAVLKTFAKDRPTITLRNIHAAAIVAGLQRAKRGQVNVLALEGNPGIGKTTAVRTYLAGPDQSGYLFLYVSPRVVINRSVTTDMARDEGKQTGILTITTNSQLIASAERWHKKQVELGLAGPRKVEGAVVADGFADLVRPQSTVLVLTPDQEQEIENEHAGSRVQKNVLSEHEDMVSDRRLPGVLATMSRTARELLDANQSVNRLVMTAALQGFRERTNNKTTIEALSTLFGNRADTVAGRDERHRFARRMPSIVVMVDELAGDGAGAPFVHAVARWLTDEFVEPFYDGESPFTVTLVVSDASLGNEVVLNRYLNAGERTPDKVLVSKSAGKQPFRVAVTRVKIGARQLDTLHVMTNSFPATELNIRYRVKLTAVTVGLTITGEQQTARQAIREAADEAVLNGARTEIMKALRDGAKQVIFFAQDKLFLRALQDALTEDRHAGLDDKNVRILDSSVPAYERKVLIQPEVRERVRVFLMTSSGARGVSFPLTDSIIAIVPRFNVEAALMEIAQLIYRGRGKYRDERGEVADGDHVPRKLVMLVDDYLLSDEGIDRRQWLRQSLDLMTLLVMLRSTIFTRITGDAALRQRLALVPVGAVGVEELISLMSQYVCDFMNQARLYQRKGKDKELQDLASRAMANVANIFSRTRLSGVSRKGEDGRTFVKSDFAREFIQSTSNTIQPLMPTVKVGEPCLPDHASFSGPVVVENWSKFEKQEIFSFEEHDAQLKEGLRQLKGQLYAIDQQRKFPAAFRVPASSLLKLLHRDDHGDANEFRTLKSLKSPNTWVSVPAGYYEFVFSELVVDGRPFSLHDEALWQEALARTLNSGSAMMPPLPSYDTFPWGASVGQLSPLNLDLVFDDRYFMASNELNLLNTLLLARDADDANNESS